MSRHRHQDGDGDDHGAGTSGEGEPDDAVGSLAEEAARLMGALSGWAREHEDDLAAGPQGLADGLADSWRQVDEHLATGAAECSVCPVCRTVHAVRGLDPDVRGHLASAAASLLQAAGLVVKGFAGAASDPGRSSGADGVEHIDLEDDSSDWDDADEDAQDGAHDEAGDEE